MKISSKISIAFILVSFIITSSFSYLFYIKAKDHLKKSIWAQLITIAKSRANHIETFLSEDKHRVRIIAESDLIESTVEKINRNTSDLNKFIAKANLILNDFMKADNEANELLILNPDGKIIASTNEKNIGTDRSADSIFFEGMKNTFIKNVHRNGTSENPMYSISTPVTDDDTKGFLGVLVANYYLDGINEITTDRTGLGETGEIYIVNKHGYMITPSRFKENTFLKQKIDTGNARNALLHNDKEGKHDHDIKDTTLATDYRGIPVLGAHEYIEEMQWRMLAEIDAEEAFKPLFEIRKMFTVILFVVPIFAWLMGVFISRKISGPVEKLSKGAEVIGRGNFDHKVGTDLKDEIGQLSRTFDQMTDNLKAVTASRDELNREVIERKHAEEQQRMNEERLNYLLTENPAVIYSSKASGDYGATFISKNIVKKMGYKPEDFTDNPKFWIDHINPEDKERVLAGLSEWNKEETHTIEYRFLHKDGYYRWVLDKVRLMLNEEGKPHEMIGSWTDITEIKHAEKKLEQLAYTDQLTQLSNRVNFLSYLERMLKRTKFQSDYMFAVLFIDLDRFKVVNDSLGHLIGDKLLIEVARRLETCTRPTDRVSRVEENDRIARFGGDEFAVFLNDVKDVSSAVRVTDRIQMELQKPFNIDGHELFTSASIGIALSSSGYKNAEDILRDADSAMYRAKDTGKAHAEIFDEEMHARVSQILKLESDLRTAVEKGEFMVYYQPIVSAADSRITGTEALIRWNHPEQGFISPMDFIPIAEETGLISTIGEWVLRTACAQNKAWQDAGYQHFLMKVNFSARQFKDENLTEVIKKVIRKTDMPAQLLDVEITETIAMEKSSIKILNQLTAMGLRTSIDDFGTGYSSLGSLTLFPINTIKIDRTFIKGITIDVSAEAIIKAIIAMAHSLNMEVIAEGVETEDQMAFLQSQKCDKVQGYLFSPPVPEEEFRKLLEKEKNGSAIIQKHSESMV